MKHIKDELQNIIIGNGSEGQAGKLEKVYNFLRRDAKAGSRPEKQKRIKSEEESVLIDFALKEGLIFNGDVSDSLFISEGAEQKVYRFDNHSVIKFPGRMSDASPPTEAIVYIKGR